MGAVLGSWTPSAQVAAVWALARDPGVSPNDSGLPGLPVVRQVVGALLTWGLVACVAGLVLSMILWALGHHNGNYSHTSSGKTRYSCLPAERS